MPKYLRANRKYQSNLDKTIRQIDASHDEPSGSKEDIEEYVYQRETIEDLLLKRTSFDTETKFEKYQPVLYEIIKDARQLADKESLTETHDRFLAGTEQMLRVHHQRSHVHDGLKHLSDREVIQKVREAPTKLKRSAKSLLYKLKKLGATLDDNGDLNTLEVENANDRKWLTKNEGLVKLTLYQSDLEFEYPQKLERMKIKADVVEMANKEEEKLEFAEFAKGAEEARRKVLTYEEYFQLDPAKDGHLMKQKPPAASSRTGTTWEEYKEQNESPNIFENDLLE